MLWASFLGSVTGAAIDPLLFVPAMVAGWKIKDALLAVLASVGIVIAVTTIYAVGFGFPSATTNQTIAARLTAAFLLTMWTYAVRRWPSGKSPK